jgi:hypothetical protein
MRFPRPLLGLTRLDRQRNPDIRSSLKVNNLIENIKTISKELVRHLERMDRSHLPKQNFQYQPPGKTECWKTEKKMEGLKTL